jgi:hypothetical protein
MQAVLLKFGAWAAKKLIAAALIVVIALAGYGLWLYVQEEGLLEKQRVERLARAMEERDALLAAKAALEARIAAVRTEIDAQKKRAEQAGKVIAALQQLESWWERWFGDKVQQAANAERLQRVQSLKQEAAGKMTELQRTLTQTIWEQDGLDVALRRVNGEVENLEASQSQARHYVLIAWDKLKWYVALALAAYFFGPTLWALVMFYGFGAFVGSGRPIRLGLEPAALPDVGESRVSIEAVLRPGEVLWIREKFLQASDEGLERRTRFVLDWRIPLTSLACGLVELVEMKNARPGAEYRVTLSNGVDPHLEMAFVDVPAGSSLVLRPSFLAGVVQREGGRLNIKRHWRVFHWQSWVTGQFRFFEFVGPCRLAIAGSRGVRTERLADREGQLAPARRTNQDATIGFTPNLEYRPVRAETFWSYYRGMNPLFDDLFAGRGLFISQETAAESSAARAGRFWSSLWNGVLKVFGL